MRAPRFALTAQESEPTKTGVATYRQLVKLTHMALDKQPSLLTDQPALEDAVKWLLGQWHLKVTESGYGASAVLARAVASAIFQRKYVAHKRTPIWQQGYQERIRAERERRKRRA